MLAIVRGLEVTTIGQVYQSLFNPDLVREALARDLNHEVEEAAKVINLDKVLDSGPAPYRHRLKSPRLSGYVIERGRGRAKIPPSQLGKNMEYRQCL